MKEIKSLVVSILTLRTNFFGRYLYDCNRIQYYKTRTGLIPETLLRFTGVTDLFSQYVISLHNTPLLLRTKPLSIPKKKNTNHDTTSGVNDPSWSQKSPPPDHYTTISKLLIKRLVTIVVVCVSGRYRLRFNCRTVVTYISTFLHTW